MSLGLRGVVVITAFVAGGAGWGGAAEKDAKEAPPVFGVGLDVVKVTVTVRDEKGNIVADLGRDDFVVYDEGKRQRIDVFVRAADAQADGSKDDPLILDAGVLLDTSESMARQLRLTQSAAVRFLESIPRARDLIAVFFDDEIRISRYSSEEQQGLFERITDAKASGYTALYDAIGVYLHRVEGGNGRKVLLLYTDGADSKSKLTRRELMSAVRGCDVTMYPIGFSGDMAPSSTLALSARGFLRELADTTGGDVFFPASYREMPKIYDRILEDLSSQYVVGFVPQNPASSETFRKLKVELVRKGLKARHRSGYLSGSRPPASAELTRP